MELQERFVGPLRQLPILQAVLFNLRDIEERFLAVMGGGIVVQ